MTKQNNLEILLTGLNYLLESDEHGLRDRQHEAINKLAISDYDHGFFNQATGIGKTTEIATFIKGYNHANTDPNKKIIVLEKLLNIVDQTIEAFTDPNTSEYIGMIKDQIGRFDGTNAETDKPIIVCTYASLKNLINEVNHDEVAMVLMDEAHNCLSDSRMNCVGSFENALVYGFTATPTYNQKKNLKTWLENEIDEISIEEGIKKGLNCSLKNISLVSDLDLSNVRRNSKGEYDLDEFDKVVKEVHKDGIKQKIVEFWDSFVDEETGERAQDRMTMINCRSLKEAQEQAEAFNKFYGKKLAMAYGSDMEKEERDAVLAGFENGKFPIIAQVATLGEGYNNKKLSLAINYPTASIIRETQGGGRPLRYDTENKLKKAWVVDIIFRHPDHKDDPITVAAEKNNQVIFAHITKKLEILSDTRKLYEESLKNKMMHLDKMSEASGKKRVVKKTNIEGFKLISTTEELLQITNEIQQWEKEHAIQDVTEHMVPTVKLQEIYVGQFAKFQNHLLNAVGTLLKDENGNEVMDKNGNAIPIAVKVKARNGHIAVFLNGIGDENIDAQIRQSFERMYGLRNKNIVVEKNEFMKITRDLNKRYVERREKIIAKLRETFSKGDILTDKSGNPIKDNQGNDIPIVVLARTKKGTNSSEMLNGIGDPKIDKLILEQFDKITGFRFNGSVITKSIYMKSAEDLTNIFIGKREFMYKFIKRLEQTGEFLKDDDGNLVLDQDQKPISMALTAQPENKSGTGVYLNGTGNKEIDDLIIKRYNEIANFARWDSVILKTEHMTSIDDMTKIFTGNNVKMSACAKKTIGVLLKDEKDNPILDKEGKEIPLILEVKSGRNSNAKVLNGTGEEEIDQMIRTAFAKHNNLKLRMPASDLLKLANTKTNNII